MLRHIRRYLIIGLLNSWVPLPTEYDSLMGILWVSLVAREVGDAVAKHIPDTSMEEHGRRDNERVVRLS